MDDQAVARARDARHAPRAASDPGGVLFVVEQLRRAVPGGIGTYIAGVLQGLAELEADGEDVAAVTLHASRSPGGSDPLASWGRRTRLSHLPSVVLTRAWDHALVHAPAGFGVVHATSLAVPPVRRAPLVVTVHDTAWRRFPDVFPERGRRWHEAALGRARRRATRFVVPSVAVAEDLARDSPEDGVTVIPHGSDHLPAPDDVGVADLLRRVGVDGPFLLSVGTLEPRKNLGRVFDAYDAARLALPEPWPLVVVGPDGWGQGVGPRPGVVLTGAVSPGVLAALYARARLLVYVPLSEGFGLPPLEAMRAGTPVLSSALPSTQGAALEVDPLDVEAMADGMVRIAVDDDVCRSMAASGAERAAALTWRASAAAHLGVWRTVR